MEKEIMEKEWTIMGNSWIYILVVIGIWFGLVLWLGWFSTIMISIIGGAIFGLYMKLTGRI